MILNVSHRTTFRYSQGVSISHHLLHLCPRHTTRQTVIRHSLIVEPPPTVIRNATDYFGNETTYITIETAHSELAIIARSTVEVLPPRTVDPAATAPWDTVEGILSARTDGDHLEACQFAFDSPQVSAGDGIRAYAAESFLPGRPLLEAAIDLTHRIYRDFKYEGGVTDVWTPVEKVLEHRHGVCQDFAHLQIACLRAFGIPARYVSGYILTHPPPGQPRLVGADASHAWLSVWIPDHGWVDLDPTNDKLAADEHVTVAWGRDYADISPINGLVVGGGRHLVDVSVDVVPEAA